MAVLGQVACIMLCSGSGRAKRKTSALRRIVKGASCNVEPCVLPFMEIGVLSCVFLQC